MEARALVRAEAEKAAYENKAAERAAKRTEGKNPRGRDPKPPQDGPGANDQVNFTDAESRIMKTASGFEQSYNAQAAVEVESRLIVGQRVTNAPTDKAELVESFTMIEEVVGPVGEVLVDNGFLSEAAVTAIEAQGSTRVLAAVNRQRHGRRVEQLEKKADPPEPGPEASFSERMAHRVATRAGRERYKLRQQTVEPIFGIIKETLGFRRFSVRSLAKTSEEWTLVTLAYNLKRLFHLGTNLAGACKRPSGAFWPSQSSLPLAVMPLSLSSPDIILSGPIFCLKSRLLGFGLSPTGC
jgi:hypothetical protein